MHFTHSVLGAIELLSLLSRPPKKPLTSVLDVVLRRRSAASFFTDSQEFALLMYESRAGEGPPRSSSSEGDGWDFPEQEKSKDVSVYGITETLFYMFKSPSSMSLWCP